MARKAARIEPEALWELFQQKGKAVADDDHFDRYEFQDIDKVGRDLGKVQFDFENCEYEHQHEFGKWEGMLGYRTLYPLSYIGVMAGGDWEYPIYFIIYLDQDGKTLRAYIPKDGNVWNHDTKSAFGNAEEADNEFLKKWIKKNRKDIVDGYGSRAAFDEEFEAYEQFDVMFDKEAIREDIRKRIEVVDGK